MGAIESKTKDLANWVRDMQRREAEQAAALKETRKEIKEVNERIIGLWADSERPLLDEVEE